jgi:ribosomal protein L11 methyltransferase
MPQATPKAWMEVSLVVAEELAEAVAEVLARFVKDGVVIESTQVIADQFDEGRSIGPLRVCGYLPCDAHLEDKRRRLEEALWHLGRICPLPEAQFKIIYETDWSEAWKQHFKPIAIGRQLLILPTWIETATTERTVVRLDPGMAFGTGTHPTTRLCLEFIEEWFARQADDALQRERETRMIDLGCGSGILAIAALKLGAVRALGVDTDPQAVEVARQNAQLNAVSDRLELATGSLIEILTGRFSLRQAELVVANILTSVLVRLLAEGLDELVVPQGWLILSGILEEQETEVVNAAEMRGLHLIKRRQSEDWVALAFTHAGNEEKRLGERPTQ